MRKPHRINLPGHARFIDRRGGDFTNTYAVILQKAKTRSDAKLALEAAASYKTRILLPGLEPGGVAKQLTKLLHHPDTDEGTRKRTRWAFQRRRKNW